MVLLGFFSYHLMPQGSGGGASIRAMAFCPSKPGSTPGMDLAFFGNAINLFSLGVGLYLKVDRS